MLAITPTALMAFAPLSLTPSTAPTVRVTLDKTMSAPIRGRVRVYFATACGPDDPPPSQQCSDDQSTAQAFGIDTPLGDGLAPGGQVVVNASTRGYPRPSLLEVPAGTYCVQAELFRYSVYKRGDGETLTLPTSCVSPGGGDGSYGSPPGTLYSDVLQKVRYDPESGSALELTLSHEVKPPAKLPGCSGTGADTDYIKTVTVDSPLLTAWWGTPLSLEACVLLPWGFDDHPDARYPLVIAHGHYSAIFEPGGRFDATPPTANMSGYDRVDQLYANYLYNNWTSADAAFKGARALVITINHPVPFFDDSYAVDSVNVGPYGTAIMTELLPAVETKYRGIGEGWARGVLGGSTGGWESFAVQVLWPDEFNYAAVACPDPIGFASYTTVDLYRDTNAYYYDAPFKKTARPGYRDKYSGTAVDANGNPAYGHPYGQTTATVEEMNRREFVLGERSRSCGQWDIWEAVFSPKGADGYPARIWCKDPSPSAGCTYGDINQTVAKYWSEKWDLTAKLKREWASGLGAKLSGKLHVFVGAGDSFFLTNAVMDLQDWATDAANPISPPFGGEIVIGAHDGRGYEHCFNGFLPDGTVAPNAVTRELYLTKFLPRMAKRWAASAPAGADMTWAQY